MNPLQPPTDELPSLGSETEPPAPIAELIGVDEELSKSWERLVIEKAGIHPRSFTGEIEGNPRDGDVYPSGGEEMMDLVDPAEDGESLLSEEFSMAMQATTSDRCGGLPPKPLTPTELQTLLEKMFDAFETNYSVWVPIEPEMIDKTAVGQYRQATQGSIIRFHIETNDTFSSFSLLANNSRCGFEWYHLSTSPAGSQMAEMAVNAGEPQRLESLLKDDGSRLLETVPDRIRSASNLLGAYIHTENPSPTPDGWITTTCEIADEAKFFNPRYNATFAHQSSDAVLEVTPLEAKSAIDEEASETSTEGLKIAIDEDTVNTPTHTWEAHFVGDETAEELSEEFDKRVQGETLVEIMAMMDQKVN